VGEGRHQKGPNSERVVKKGGGGGERDKETEKKTGIHNPRQSAFLGLEIPPKRGGVLTDCINKKGAGAGFQGKEHAASEAVQHTREENCKKKESKPIKTGRGDTTNTQGGGLTPRITESLKDTNFSETPNLQGIRPGGARNLDLGHLSSHEEGGPSSQNPGAIKTDPGGTTPSIKKGGRSGR